MITDKDIMRLFNMNGDALIPKKLNTKEEILSCIESCIFVTDLCRHLPVGKKGEAKMGKYGDDDYYCNQKNSLYYHIMDFLKNHPLSETLNIVADVVEEKELSF